MDRKFKEVAEIPAEGQFVVINKYDGKIWANTYRWEGDYLCCYSEGSDRWIASAYWDHYEEQFRVFRENSDWLEIYILEEK